MVAVWEGWRILHSPPSKPWACQTATRLSGEKLETDVTQKKTVDLKGNFSKLIVDGQGLLETDYD